MLNNNLGSFLHGPTGRRECQDLKVLARRVESQWSGSPLARMPLEELAAELVREVAGGTRRAMSQTLIEALIDATAELLEWEDVGPLEIDWPAVQADGLVALRVRQMLNRRARWIDQFAEMRAAMVRTLSQAFAPVLQAAGAIPARTAAPAGAALELTLAELLDQPAVAVERVMRTAQDAAEDPHGLMSRLHEILARNLARASGLPPGADPSTLKKVLLPSQQKDLAPVELSRTYLAGTPFVALLALPAPFEVPEAARFEHCHVIGGTGHGKTQLLQRMIWADLVRAQKDRRSVVVIDSQGDLINKLVRLQIFDPGRPEGLADRLVIVDPSDVEYPAALNLFDAKLDRLKRYRAADRERVLNGVVELYETFFGDMLGAELTQKQGVIFKYLAHVMLVIPDATIHTLMRLMEDGRPFRPYMAQLEGSARWFFEKEFFDSSFSATKKQILKRLWGVLSTPAFERMFAQPTNKLDIFQALNDGKIILINTAKDLLKREGSQLFGRFFIGLLAQATLERSVLVPGKRNPTFVYVDEAQEYFDDAVESILTQARKYRVGLTLAHQTLDQLSPRLRSALLANSTVKCAGGVSSKDARALADEMRTSSDFIESMRRQGDRTEFAVWVKQSTPQAIRLSVPIGFLERQPTLTEEAYDALIDANRKRYCGTLDEARSRMGVPGSFASEPNPPAITPRVPLDEPTAEAAVAGAQTPEPATVQDMPKVSAPPPADVPIEADSVAEESTQTEEPSATPSPPLRPRRPVEARELGKGGPKHRYLQALIKELGEQNGFRAIIEAPLPYGRGQIDVLLEQGELAVAIEVSVTTPPDWERENLRKCLDAEYAHIVLVLAKTRGQARYREAVLSGFSPEERKRITVLAPEEVLDHVASLAPQLKPDETVVKGYKVRVTHAAIPPSEAKARRQALAKVIADSLRRRGD
ncbi:MAG TPA: type IV secretion system DNA-binding domain-containing protein [Caulobacteraceae bacterium]|jgi:hypothetical protein